MHPLIEDVRLQPKKVLFFCANSNPADRNKIYRGRPCEGTASLVCVASGRAIGNYCATCMGREIPDLRKIDPEADWHTEPLYHCNPDYPEQSLDRRTGKL